MSRRITIVLGDLQEEYFDELMYSLDLPEGQTTPSSVINHALLELLLFEKITQDQVTNFLMDNNESRYRKALQDLKEHEEYLRLLKKRQEGSSSIQDNT